MKTYPSILNANYSKTLDFDAYVFDKLDGSNLRFEWDKKKGWDKFGTRTRLFDQSDLVFGEAIPLFFEHFSLQLETVFKEHRYEKATAFFEFHGQNSFAGMHVPEDPKKITLIDVAPHKKGVLGPKEFLELFGHLEIARFLGIHRWDQDFVTLVREEKLQGVTFEGVVGKAGSGHNLTMVKAKTQSWLDAVRLKCGDDADKIIRS